MLQKLWNPQPVGEHGLLDDLVVRVPFAPGRPRPWNRDLVDHRQVHVASPSVTVPAARAVVDPPTRVT